VTVSRYASKYIHLFLSFRRVLNVICSFLGNSPAPGNYPKRNELQTYSRFHMWSMPTESNVDLAEFTNYASRLLKLWFVFRKYGRFHDPRSRLLSPVLGEVGWGGREFLHRGITSEDLANAQSNLDISSHWSRNLYTETFTVCSESTKMSRNTSSKNFNPP